MQSDAPRSREELSTMRYVCRFRPSYCNSEKDVPCETRNHAITMAAWFKGIGTDAWVVGITETETIITPE